MDRAFVDTNLIVRAITGDHPDHSPRARAFFESLADGAERSTTLGEVLAESVYVLASPRLYGLTRAEIARHLGAIVRLAGLELADKPVYLTALDLYAAHPRLKFVDAVVAAFALDRGLPVASFDRGYDRVPDLVRTEPPPTA